MNEPQLSAEMEKRFDEEFNPKKLNVLPIKVAPKDIKHFLATALEEQREWIISRLEKMQTIPASSAKELIISIQKLQMDLEKARE